MLACLFHLEACLLLSLLHLQFVDVEEGVHLRQLSLRVVGVDRVVDDVHLIVHVSSFLEAPQSLKDLCALFPDADELRLVAGIFQESHAAVVEGECLLEEALFLTELATVVEPLLVEEALLTGAALLHLVEHLCGLVEFVETQRTLGTAQIIVSLTVLRLVGILLIVAFDEFSPDVGHLLDLLIVVLQFEHVDVVGEDVGELQGLGVYLHEQVDTLLVGVGGFLMVVHVGVDITHGIVGHTHAVAVVALLGVLVHGVYLLQTRIGLSCEVEGLHKDGPRLIIVLPVLHGSEELEGVGCLFVDGVVEVVVVEEDDLLYPGVGLFLEVTLLMTFSDNLVDAAQLVVNVVELLTEVVDLLQDVDTLDTLCLCERLSHLFGLVSKHRDRRDAQEQCYQPAVEVHISTLFF